MNEEENIRKLLESIEEQEIDNYEVIIADNKSKDNTLNIAKKYGCKITKGGLPAKGRNNGAKIAKGNLFLFLDADTILPMGALKKALLEFEKRKLGIASCSLELLVEKYKIIYNICYNLLYNWPIRVLENVFPYASNFILVKKEIHNKIKGFDEGIKLAEDHSYARKAAKIAKFGFLKSLSFILIPRRFKNEGWLRVGLKYYFCNLYNVFFGDVKSDIFQYDFKRQRTEGKIPKIKIGIINVIRSFIWFVFFILLFLLSLLTWPIIFLIFTPKLICQCLKININII